MQGTLPVGIIRSYLRDTNGPGIQWTVVACHGIFVCAEFVECVNVCFGELVSLVKYIETLS
jgi:hypothetical protein